MNERTRLVVTGLGLLAWIALTFSATLTATFVSTEGWYRELVKPAWNPPDRLFGPVWTVLYAMMAVAAWLVWKDGGWQKRKLPLALYLIQWVLNALWTPLFFGMHRPGLAFVEIVLLLMAVTVTLAAFWKVRPVAGVLMLPYALWVLFATILNGTIWRLNG